MTKRFTTIFLILLLAIPIAWSQSDARRITPAGGTKRLALVIGNDSYSWAPLTNAVNDARSISSALADAGFQRGDITVLTNSPMSNLRRGVSSFLEQVRPGDMAFVFYSGHGVEVKGQNYLLPVDFPRDTTEFDVADYAYSAQRILDGLQERGAGIRIVILDACRDNPLRAAKSAGGGGLARMEGRGTLVVFATEAGRTASDNRGSGNGLFTTHLLEGLRKAGTPADTMFKEVARAVDKASAGKQTPQVYGLLLEDFAFRPGQQQVARLDAAAEAWALIRSSENAEDFDRFARDFAGHEMAKVAVLRAGQLRRQVAVVAAPAAPVAAPGAREKLVGGLKYVWVPPGSFRMGCSEGDVECIADEKPAHQVKISRGFWMGETEVTQGAYQRVVGKNPSNFEGSDLPVEQVNWDQAKSYCVGLGLRLPTEGEWEYAARGGSTEARYGSLDGVGWHDGNSGNQTHPVGKKEANGFGLYDMLGNVYEWTSDWYGEYGAASATDPKGPMSGNFRLLRGGSWVYIPQLVRASLRSRLEPAGRVSDIGFRCVGE